MAGKIFRLLLAGFSVIGYRAGVEEPSYSIVGHIGELEIRRYGRRLAAETTLSGKTMEETRRAAFQILADYIFGNNKAKTKIAMTAPVAQSSQQISMTAPVSQQRTAEDWAMKFFLPSDLTVDTAPEPKDRRVKLIIVSEQDYAVLRFTGRRDDEAVQSHIARLKAALSGSAWQSAGEAVAWLHDPPWTLPFLRRNEVAINVHRSGVKD
ncbi:SOUL family heme-binding protein [Mesorhizobium sp. UC22_110]|uniref:SOUL family heme-binding protein n=1 Tax=unclassified Mesorhizobium TaxID=325217 RepID=UPI00366B3908